MPDARWGNQNADTWSRTVTDTALPDDDTQTAWARLVRVSQAKLAAVEAELRRQGFPPLAQYDALLELRRAGDDGLRPFELQREMLLAQYNVSRLVDRLAKAGWIDRHDSAEDGRGQVLKITPQGLDLLRAMWPVYGRAIQAHVGARLTRSDIRKLTELMSKLET